MEAINVRLRLVEQLKSYKESRGLDFVDPEREEWMLRDVTRANRGPLSGQGLEEIYTAMRDENRAAAGASSVELPKPPSQGY